VHRAQESHQFQRALGEIHGEAGRRGELQGSGRGVSANRLAGAGAGTNGQHVASRLHSLEKPWFMVRTVSTQGAPTSQFVNSASFEHPAVSAPRSQSWRNSVKPCAFLPSRGASPSRPRSPPALLCEARCLPQAGRFSLDAGRFLLQAGFFPEAGCWSKETAKSVPVARPPLCELGFARRRRAACSRGCLS
jgi:hypothetical protein